MQISFFFGKKNVLCICLTVSFLFSSFPFSSSFLSVHRYYEGVLKRQGSYRNSGSYGGSVSRLSAGSSIGTNINKDEGVMQAVLRNSRNKID
jgi:hypothetical protein